jgi:hypothetical protein
MASNTSRRGASKSRVNRISTSDGVVTVKLSLFAVPLPIMSCLLPFHFLKIGIQPVESLFPNVPVPLGPLGHVLERTRLEAAVPPLCLASAGDETGALEHAQVLRHGRQIMSNGSASSVTERSPARSWVGCPLRGVGECSEGTLSESGVIAKNLSVN